MEPASRYEEEDDDAPSWERDTPFRMLSIKYPRNIGGYRQTCPEVYEEYWQAWLDKIADKDEIKRIPIYKHLI